MTAVATIASTGLASGKAAGSAVITATSCSISGSTTPMVTDFSLSASPSTSSVKAGQSTGFTLTVARLSGFNQTVLLSSPGSLHRRLAPFHPVRSR